MAIHVEKPGGSNPTALEKGRRNSQPRVANPGDGSFTGTGVHKYKGELAKATADVHKFGADASAAKFALVQCGGWIIADNSDVTGAEPPALTSQEGSGDLAARHDFGSQHFDFSSQSREFGQAQDGIGGVFADAENIE